MRRFALLSVALLAGCFAGPQQLRRSVDDWDHKNYVNSPWWSATLWAVPVIPVMYVGAFAGDFLVANLSKDERRLEMVLVDVCGKGVGAGSQSLQFAGALGGLIGALPPIGLFGAANDFLLRQHWDEGFATAVHVLVDLHTGEYSILNAGHPPAMRWDAVAGDWIIDGARGLALGIDERPEFHQTTGRLDLGDALVFYTDGVVESRRRDIGAGIEWLRDVARPIAAAGLDHAPRRILALVTEGGDDRAVLVIERRA